MMARFRRCVWFGLLSTLTVAFPSICLAQQQSTNIDQPQPHGLAVVDWLIIAAYGIGVISLGAYYSRRQRTTQEYFVGSGRMNPLFIGVSLFATLLSTISYLSMPGEALGKGPAWMLVTLGYPFVFLFVAYVLLPVYMRQRVTSAYELLEVKLGLSVRLLGAAMFLLLRLVWMSLLVFLTAKAMTIMLGVDESWIPAIVLATGLVAVVYTSLGGLEAVVITDFAQTILLYGGALLIIIMVSLDMGGLGWVPTKWNPNWDRQPLFSLDPSVRVTVLGSILSMFIWHISTLGGDQTSVQRFMSTHDVHAARRALATQLTVGFLVAVTLAFVGFALLGYFEAHPERIPTGLSLKDDADKMFPRFIAYHLPPGVSGLVVAAMFAAAMSSIDSGVNSITAVVMTDFLDRFGLKPQDERKHVLAARCLAFGIGAVVVIGSSFMEHVPGNITAVTGKTSNLLTTPIFCLFVFALFIPFSTTLGTWVGAICGTMTAAAIAFSGPLVVLLATWFDVDPSLFNVELTQTIDPETGRTLMTAPDPISFQWIAPIAILVNLMAGSAVSLLLPSSRRAAEAASTES